MTTWIDLDANLLGLFGLTRDDILARDEQERISRRRAEQSPPTLPDLHHAQGREEALGPWSGGRLPRHAIRKTLGGPHHPLPAIDSKFIVVPRLPRAAAQRPRPNWTPGSEMALPTTSSHSASGRRLILSFPASN